MASYSVNDRALARARELIEARQYVLDSDWGEIQPSADEENEYLSSHLWDQFAEWHLGLTEGPAEETKARYAFVYGRHKEIELAAHELLQVLDATAGPTGRRE